MRDCQLGWSPPCPSASMTWLPYFPIALSLCCVSEAEHAAGQVAGLQIVQRAAEVLERVVLRDQLVDLEAAVQVQIGEHREVAARPRGAVAATEDRLVLVERLHDEVEAGAELRHADDRECAARAERVERLLDDGDVA